MATLINEIVFENLKTYTTISLLEQSFQVHHFVDFSNSLSASPIRFNRSGTRRYMVAKNDLHPASRYKGYYTCIVVQGWEERDASSQNRNTQLAQLPIAGPNR